MLIIQRQADFSRNFNQLFRLHSNIAFLHNPEILKLISCASKQR